MIGTSTVAFAGFVSVTSGDTGDRHSVVKENGFGMGPGSTTPGFPSMSFPPNSSAVYVMHGSKEGEGLRVTYVLFAFQVATRGTSGGDCGVRLEAVHRLIEGDPHRAIDCRHKAKVQHSRRGA